MSNNTNDFGALWSKDALIQRKYFEELCRLWGHNCQYRAPKKNKKLDMYGDLDANYEPAEQIGCIFDQYPDQKSLKKAGWVAELQEGSSLIHVPYNTPNLQFGSLFQIPSGLDFAEPRWFRVIMLSNISIYPASIACEIAPEYISEDKTHLVNDFTQDTQVVLLDIEGDD